MSGQYQLTPGDLIAVAAIIFGFGITVFTFRIQREVTVGDKGWPKWLPLADRLIVVSVGLVFCFAVIPLLAFELSRSTVGLASAACIAALVLQVGYVPAIMAHYRIEIGKNRTGPREKGEPAERLFVWISTLIAALGFAFVLFEHLHS
jgi:hypothetical protein